ncbi:MAG TPA: PqqD family protein [Nitriliruptorales bacterium]|nr:PqqD family protein [Nitriliruptorales bacterium]
MRLMTDPDDIDLSFAPRRARDVAAVELERRAVLYRSGEMLQLDELATLLWNCFDGQTRLEALVDDLVCVYGTDRTAVEADVVSFARNLGHEGLLEGVQAAQAG